MIIEAYFDEMKTAHEAVKKLKESGFDKAYVDLNDHYIDDRNVKTNLPGTDTSASLSGLVLESDSDGIGRDKAPLNAASPMVSGYGRFEEIADVACKVIIETDEKLKEKVKSIISGLGGTLENPNIEKPKFAYDREFQIHKAIQDTYKDL